MSGFRCFLVSLFLSGVSLDAHCQVQPVLQLQTISAQSFTLDIPISWGFQLEEHKGQFGAGLNNAKGNYPSPWLIIEYCVFDPNATLDVKICEAPCPAEDQGMGLFDDQEGKVKMTPLVKSKQEDEMRYFRRLIDSSPHHELQMMSCSPKGVAVAILLFENEESLEFFETILRSFRWK